MKEGTKSWIRTFGCAALFILGLYVGIDTGHQQGHKAGLAETWTPGEDIAMLEGWSSALLFAESLGCFEDSDSIFIANIQYRTTKQFLDSIADFHYERGRKEHRNNHDSIARINIERGEKQAWGEIKAILSQHESSKWPSDTLFFGFDSLELADRNIARRMIIPTGRQR